MTEVRRIDPETGFIREFKEIAARVGSLETKPAGSIVIRETLTTEDPETGVKTTIGQLPDGSYGFQPFIGDIVPPPVATTPVVSAQPGNITVSWDGDFVGGAEKPNDFQHVNVKAHKIVTGATVLTLTVGVIRLATEQVIITTDVLSYGETWEFSLESEDYNGNRAALSARSAPVAVLSNVDDSLVGEALAELALAAQTAQEAAQAAQDAADDAQQAADDAIEDALAANNLADGKGKVIIQTASPSVDDQLSQNLWIDTTGGANTPKRWNGSAWVVVTDKVASDAAIAAGNAQNKADQAFNNAADAAEDAGNAQDTADGKGRLWYQDAQPAGIGHNIGDTWFDTNDNYTQRTWNGSIWQTTQDAWRAQQTADSKGITYTQNTVPPVEARLPQNLWNDTSLGLDKVVTKYWSTTAGAWTALADKEATEARVIADAKSETIYSSTAPTVAQRLPQNLWVDTTGGININKRWDGSGWVVVADTRIASTATAVTAADSKAQSALDEAIAKSVVYTQNTVPPVAARLPQTIWNDTSLGLDKIVVKYWNGTAWTSLADKTATDAAVVADSKGETIYSATEPAAAKRLTQNLWIDTTGGININKRWDGSGWVVVADTRIAATAVAVTAAQATADAKSVVYTQNTTPPVEARLPQTIWNDTSLGLTNVVVKYWNGSAWTATADKTATDAAIVADSKGEIIYSDTEPVAAKRLAQNLWIDTTGGININKRWNGSTWAIVADTRIASTAAAVTAVDAKADTKSVVYTQSTTPPVEARLPQTLWNDTSLGLTNIVVKYWNGSAWTPLADKAATDAQASAVNAMNAQSYSNNASFDDWTGSYPLGFTLFGTVAPTKETTIIRRAPFSPRFAIADTTVQGGLTFGAGSSIISHIPNLEYFTVEMEFQLVSGGLGGAGMILDWAGLTNGRAQINLASEIANPITGKWYRITKTLRRPTNSTGTWTSMAGYVMAQWSGHGTGAAKNIVFDWFNIRPSTTEEITAYGAPAKYTELESATAAKGEVIYSDTAPAAAKQLAQNLWVDTTGGINMHKRWTGAAWSVVADSRIAQTITDLAAISSQVSAVSAQADRSITTFYGSSTPSTPESGDLWLTGVAGEPMKRYNGSAWAAFEDPNVQAAYGKAGDAQAAADAKVRTFAQDAEPTGMIPDDVGDLWIDTNDNNKLWRYSGAAWVAVQDATIAIAQSTASAAVSAAQGAQGTADGKNTNYYQNDEPTGGTYKVGDTWFDTNDNYKIRTYAGSGVWQLTQDSAGAITTAAADATTKATNAQTAAALDATAKADAAQLAAIQAQAYSLNPSFEDWTGTIPANYTTFVTNPTKETTTVRTGKNAVRFNCTDATTQRGLQFNAALAHAPYFEYLTVELEVRLVSGSSFAGAGVLVDWTGMTGGNRATISLATEIPTPSTGKWYRVTKVIRKPATATGTLSAYSAWLMGQYSSGMGTMVVKDVIFDWINVRPSTTEEITAYGTPASITTLNDVLITKTKSWFQPAQPSLTGNTTGDLWFDTDDGNKIYIWNGAWTVAQDQQITSLNTAVTAAQASANGKNKVIYSTSAASGTTGYVAGDTWFQRDGSNNIIGQWEFTTSWQSRAIDNAVIANLNAAKLTAGTIAADRFAANSVAANKILVGDFTNLAADGNFTDTNKLNWFGSGTVTVSAGQANRLRVVTAASGNNDQANGNLVQVTPGEQIYGEAYVYGEPANVGGGGPNMHLVVVDNNGALSWPTFQSYGRSAVSGAWTKISGKIIIPANAKTAKVELAVSYSADAVGNIYYFRDVSVRRMATGSLIVDGAITANSAIIETGAIGNAHIGDLAVGTAEIQNVAITTAKINDLAVTGAKIEDLAVTNAKIANATIQSAKIGSVDAGTITVGQLTGAQINATAIDGKTITGATVQTEITASRGIKLTSTELAGYDGAGVKNFSLTSTGTLTVRGAIQSGSTIEGATITGTTGVQTSATALRGVKLTNTGITTYDNSGNMTFKVDGTTGIVEAPGILANSIVGDKIAAKTIGVDKLTVQDFSNYVENPGFETGDLKGWDVVGGWFANTAAPYSGTWKALTQYNGATQSITNKAEVTLPVGGKVRVKFRLYSEAPTSGVQVSVALYNSIGGALESVTNLANTGNWVEMDQQLTATTAGAKRLQISTNGVGTGYVRVDSVVMNRMMNGELIVDGAIDGKLITGATIQTEITASRGIKLTSAELAGYDGAGIKNFSLSSAGVLAVKGEIKSGSVITGATLAAAGGGIETTTTPLRGVKLKDTGITTYDASGNMTFSVNASTGEVEAPGIKANSITGDKLVAKSIATDKLLIGSTDNLVSEPDFKAGGLAWGLSAGYTIDPTGSRNGGPAFKIVNAASQQGKYNLPLEVPVNEESSYHFSAWIKSDVAIPVNGVALYFRTKNAAGAFTTPVAVNSPAILANTWTKISGIYKTPVGALTASFGVFSQSIFSTGSLWVDFVSVTRAADGSLVVDGAIDGKVITGATIQTIVTTDRGIKLTSTELAGYDAVGIKNFSLTSAGALTLKGAIQSGSTITGATLTGAGIETTATALRGVKLTSTGITTYDGSGNMTFKVDATTGLVEAPGLKANSITGTMIAGETITAKNLFVGDFANLATIDELNGITVSSYGQTQIVAGYNKLVTDSGSFLMFTEKRGPVPFALNDTIYYEFTAKATSATTAQFGAWTYDAADANLSTLGIAENIGTTDTLIKGQVVVSSYKANATKFVVGLSGVANKGIQIKGVKVYKKYGGNLIVDGAIDGKLITGATIQTDIGATTGIKLTPTELAGWDGAVKNFSLTSAGALTLKGAIQSGSTITGTTIVGGSVETSATALSGIKMTSTGIKAYDAGNNLTFHLDSTTGLLEVPGIKSNSIKGDKIEGGTVSADKLMISNSSNLLVDPNFWDANINAAKFTSSSGGTAGWAVSAGTSTGLRYVSRTTTTTNDVLHLAPFSNGTGKQTQAIQVQEGQKWLFTVDIETDVSAGVRWNTYKYLADGTTSYTSASGYNTATGRRELSYVWTVPAGVVSFSPALACNISGAVFKVHGNGFVGQQAKATLIEDGAIKTVHVTTNTLDGGVITAGTLKATKIEAKSIGVDQLTISSSDNLVVESAFESVATPGVNWTRGTNQIIQVGGGRDGANAMRLTGTVSINYTYNLNNKVQVDDDSRFKVTMWVRSNVLLTSDKLRLGVKPYKGTTILTNTALFRNSSNSASANYVPTGNVWTKIEGVTDPLPAGTTAVEWFVNCTAPSTTATIDIDSVSVTRAADGKLVVDGAIDGKTITGALIQTAATGARVVLDGTGIFGYDSLGVNYLMGNSSGLTLTGMLKNKGVSDDDVTPVPMTVYVGNLDMPDTSWDPIGMHFAIDAKELGTYKYVPPRVFSPNGTELQLQSGIDYNGNPSIPAPYSSINLQPGHAQLHGSDNAFVTAGDFVQIQTHATDPGFVRLSSSDVYLGRANGTSKVYIKELEAFPARYFQSTIVASYPPTGQLWGPGVFTRHSVSIGDSFVSFPTNDKILINEAGVYVFEFIFWLKYIGGGQPRALFQRDDGGGVWSTVAASQRLTDSALWEFGMHRTTHVSAGVTFRLNFAQDSGATQQWDTQLMITKIA